MDIRKYVKIKALPGGEPTSSAYYSGIVFTKNVTHKKMRREITYVDLCYVLSHHITSHHISLCLHRRPKILMLGFPIELQRSVLCI